MKFWIILAVLFVVALVVVVFSCLKVASEYDIATEREIKDVDEV